MPEEQVTQAKATPISPKATSNMGVARNRQPKAELLPMRNTVIFGTTVRAFFHRVGVIVHKGRK